MRGAGGQAGGFQDGGLTLPTDGKSSFRVGTAFADLQLPRQFASVRAYADFLSDLRGGVPFIAQLTNLRDALGARYIPWEGLLFGYGCGDHSREALSLGAAG